MKRVGAVLLLVASWQLVFNPIHGQTTLPTPPAATTAPAPPPTTTTLSALQVAQAEMGVALNFWTDVCTGKEVATPAMAPHQNEYCRLLRAYNPGYVAHQCGPLSVCNVEVQLTSYPLSWTETDYACTGGCPLLTECLPDTARLTCLVHGLIGLPPFICNQFAFTNLAQLQSLSTCQ